MYSSYQYHYGGQAAAAKGASDSPQKNQPAAAASSGSSSMFVAKVDWGSAPGGGAAASNVSSLTNCTIGIFQNREHITDFCAFLVTWLASIKSNLHNLWWFVDNGV